VGSGGRGLIVKRPDVLEVPNPAAAVRRRCGGPGSTADELFRIENGSFGGGYASAPKTEVINRIFSTNFGSLSDRIPKVISTQEIIQIT